MRSLRIMPPQRVIATYLRYDPETGKLFWHPREPAMMCCSARTAGIRAKAFNDRYAGKEAFTARDPRGYRVGSLLDRRYWAHRLIWMLVHGIQPDEIDHINRDKGDNRLANLRSVSREQNSRNLSRPRTNQSGYCGVDWREDVQKWRASINVSGGFVHLGLFAYKAEAIAARQIANKRYAFSPTHGNAPIPNPIEARDQ